MRIPKLKISLELEFSSKDYRILKSEKDFYKVLDEELKIIGFLVKEKAIKHLKKHGVKL